MGYYGSVGLIEYVDIIIIIIIRLVKRRTQSYRGLAGADPPC